MEEMAKSSKFTVKRKNENWRSDVYEPAYEKYFQSQCKKSNIFVKVNDYHLNVFVHIDKQDKNGKNSKISLRLDEFYNLFSAPDDLIECVNECVKELKKKYGVNPGSKEDEIEYQCIPKSQRTIEMEKSAAEQEEDDKLFEEFKKQRAEKTKKNKKDQKEEKENKEKRAKNKGKEASSEEEEEEEDDASSGEE